MLARTLLAGCRPPPAGPSKRSDPGRCRFRCSRPRALGLVASPAAESLDRLDWRQAAEVIGLVGPEGGFTAAELAVAAADGWPLVTLGPHVLRVETAAVALAARVAGSLGQ